MKNRLPDFALALGVALLAPLAVGMASVDFSAPLQLRSDYLLHLFYVKTLWLYGSLAANPDLAFPGQGDFMAFPTPDIVENWLIHALHLFTDNYFTALSVFVTLCFSTAALSAYVALRVMTATRWMAFCGALTFGTCAFLCGRGLAHPYFCFVVVIPWVIGFCYLHFYQRARLARPALQLKVWHGAVLGLAAASCGLYYAFFSAAFLVLTLLLLTVNRPRFAVFVPGLVALGVLGATFAVWLAPHALYVFDNHIAFPQRNAFEQTLYGLRLPDLLLPDLPPFRSVYRHFASLQDKVSDEGNFAVLGLWGMVGLVGGIGVCVAQAFRRKALRHVMRRALMIRLGAFYMTAAILFALPYGVGLVFNLLVNATIRAQCRVSIFILFMATLASVQLLEAWRRARPAPRLRAVFYGGTTLLLLLTLAPTFQTMAEVQPRQTDAWTAKRDSIRTALRRLDERGLNAVAQLPAYYYPEGPTLPEFGNSDHLWPYLLDASRERKWSFGAMAHHPQWKVLSVISQWPAEAFFPALRCEGFDAVMAEKKALSADYVTRLQERAAKLGGLVVLLDDPQRLVFDIARVPPDSAVCAEVSRLKRTAAQ